MKNIRLHNYPDFDQKTGNIIHRLLKSIKIDSDEPCGITSIDSNSGDNCEYYHVSDDHAEIIKMLVDRIKKLEMEKYNEGVHAGSNLLIQLNNGDITTNDFIRRTGRESQ